MSDTVLQAVTHNALPIGARLDEFEIRSVIGEGGFGIVYHAFDHALERDVAIKEYMPSAMAARDATMHVSVLSKGHVETFTLGLRSFVNEARLLARFDHPSLVKVHRFWEANGTAYMVMPYYRGRTLKVLRKSLGASPSETWLRGLVEPLLGALETLHREGVFHRDISPDNIMIGDDGRPVLLDFGAARHVISDQSQTLTAILKPNFAPIEQYGEAEGLRQGPWTDLYALGATLHFAVTGTPPQPATARAMGSQLDRLASVARRGVSAEFLRAIDWMMAPRPEDRPQSVAALRERLSGTSAPAPTPEPVQPKADESAWKATMASQDTVTAALEFMEAVPTREVRRGAGRGSSRRVRQALFAGAAILAVGIAAGWMLNAAESPVASAATQPVTSAPPTVIAPAPAASLPVAVALPAADAPPAAASMPLAEAAAPMSSASAPALALALAAAPAVAASAVEPVASVAPAVAPVAAKAASVPQPRPKRPPKPAEAAVVKNVWPESAGPTSPPIAVDVAAVTPSDQCSGRVLLAWYRCVKRACQAAPQFASRHECQRVRQIEADNARPRTQ